MIGLGISLTRAAPSSGGGDGISSLYTTADFVQTNTASHSETLGANAFRGARTAGGYGRLTLTIPNGDYLIGGSGVIAYDGALTVSNIDFDVLDTGTRLFRKTAAEGAWEESITITTGLIRFQTFSSGGGYRVDGFYVRSA